MFFIDVYYTPEQILESAFLTNEYLDKPIETIPTSDLKDAIFISRKYLKLGYSVYIENHSY